MIRDIETGAVFDWYGCSGYFTKNISEVRNGIYESKEEAFKEIARYDGEFTGMYIEVVEIIKLK